MSQQAASAKKETTKKSSSSALPKVSEPSLNMDELRELANLVNENGFTDFEFENANIRVRLSKNPAPQYIQAMPQSAPSFAAPVSTQIQNTAPPNNAESQSETTSAEPTTDADLHIITSPIVGTFYRSPSPDKESYIKEGSNVSPDTIVCIVEAMKLMNEIEAEVSGEVVKIYVENGQPVEFGQPLFGIKK
ncbi:MAG: acetyl-CoA carboxylase biotin carboxyl carrier protein [Pyrinomonadaceae bacterium]|nr:acetyl-CoA carboxylase biotin carboxyl carrier protein [Pyrinomonadaceae bacterium]